MPHFHDNALIGASGQGGEYTIAKSLRLRSSASAYLNRTPASAGNRKTWTWSAWVKRGTLSGNFYFMSVGGSYTDTGFMGIGMVDTGSGQAANFNLTTGTQVFRRSNALYRDPSAWYHLIVSFDTTQSTAANRVKMYVNGVELTSFAISNDPTQNTDYGINQSSSTTIAKNSFLSSEYFDGYIAENYFVDGQALTPSSFGETDSITGVWKPKAYSGTYGTNGFYLPFTDVATTSGSNAGLGKDFSGNGNYWTTNNISVTSGSTYDSMTDVPTLTSVTAANYCVLNPVSNIGNGTISAGNLNYVATSAAWMSCAGTIFPSSGKWYFEVTLDQFNSSFMIGVCSSSFTSWGTYAGASAYAWALQGTSSGTGKWNNNSSATLASGEVAATNDKYMVAYDIDAGKLWFGKNGTWYSSGDPTAGTNAVYTSVTGSLSPVLSSSTTTDKLAINLGQRPFTYTPPTGYKALNTYNLPDSTIVAGNTVFDATTYAGNSTARSITNAGSFKPDFVWIKDRTSGTPWHQLQDSVRGATKQLFSNATDAEDTNTTKLTSFDSSGFSLGNSGAVNATGDNYVAWQWQAGQGTTSSNTDGSITSTVSVNASAGFSVVSWTGTGANATVGHGLGVAPKLFITKNRAIGTTDWLVYHASLGATNYVRLNLTNASAASAIAFNNTAPTSSVFSVGTWDTGNGNGNAMITYCWAEIQGFSKAFSYTGNGSTDGAFVYCGFRPRYVLIKRTDNVSDWWVLDSARDSYNVVAQSMYANSSAAEFTETDLDFLSNGFKLRKTTSPNSSGGTFIGIAFAESPFKHSLAR